MVNTYLKMAHTLGICEEGTPLNTVSLLPTSHLSSTQTANHGQLQRAQLLISLIMFQGDRHYFHSWSSEEDSVDIVRWETQGEWETEFSSTNTNGIARETQVLRASCSQENG